MNNKGGIIFLTVIITLICIYQLSFTLKSRSIEKEINEEAILATDGSNEKLALFKKSYKDSLREKKVYDLGFKEYSYNEVNKNKLKLGLDLQGGMLITLIVSPNELINKYSGENPDEDFQSALASAKIKLKNSQESYLDLFYKDFVALKGEGRLANIFMTESNQSSINAESDDSDVLEVLNSEIDMAIKSAKLVLSNRLNKYGSSQPIIQIIQNTGRIEIQLPGEEDSKRVMGLIGGEAKLEFLELWHGSEVQPVMMVINDYLIKKRELEKELASSNEVDGTGVSEVENIDSESDQEEDDLGNLFVDEEKDTVNVTPEDSAALAAKESFPFADYFQFTQTDKRGDVQFYAKRKDFDKIKALFEEEGLKNLLPSNFYLMWSDALNKIKEGESVDGFVPVYFVKKGDDYPARLTGDYIDDARQGSDQISSAITVSMTMNAEGAKIWEQITEENIGKRIGIAMDDIMFSAPNVSVVIPNGQSVISGNFTIEEAQDLASVLKAGRLPVRTEIERMVTVGPSLGQEAINRGLKSLVIGLLLVVIFMVMYYNKGGLVANLALLFNIFFILGILSTPAIEATLTLPGIAGIVLTIGMSIDANVLIFERIREEIKVGKPVKIAIANGYKKAFTTIIDSNATTLITAIILFAFGSALVKGFAITLIIGIACSFFSAVFITRVVMEVITKNKDASKLSFTTVLSKKLFEKQSFNFIAKRKMAYIISGIIISVGIGSIIAQGGLNLGVAFKGGYSYVVGFDSDVEASVVKEDLKASFKDASTEVKTFDGNDKLKITTSYMIESDADNADEVVVTALMNGLKKYESQNPKILESILVGSTIADDIQSTSITSTLFALAAIFIYIIFRFRKWQFGLGAICALFHDILIVFSVFSITRLLGISYEIDEVFIGALLTVVGYSINDTVVVFDRVREFLTGKKHGDLGETLNTSLNSTLSRTLMTSVTTLLVVLILFLFGGEALKGFSYALLIGVLVGTYSSIFIATPVVMDASKKEEA